MQNKKRLTKHVIENTSWPAWQKVSLPHLMYLDKGSYSGLPSWFSHAMLELA